MATRTVVPASTTESPVLRAARYRVRFDSAMQAALCARIAGACRYVRDHMPADCQWRYRMGKMYRIGPKPSVSFYPLGQRFTVLRNDPAHAWLQAYPAAVVRYALKYPADAYARSFASAEAGLPRFKSRHRTTPGFTIPQAVRLDGTHLHITQGGPGAAVRQPRPVPGMPGPAGAVAEGRHGTASPVVCPCVPRSAG